MEFSCAPEPPVAWQGLLGYLNLSAGKPDPRFQGQWHAACRMPEVAAAAHSNAALAEILRTELTRLQREGAAAFRDVSQAQAVISAVLIELPGEYRRHHADQLQACRDSDLFAPFFLARACEAVLAIRSHDAAANVVPAAIDRLNDFVGYRPTPVLESRRAGEIYAHERFRPVPIYLRGVGVAAGRHQTLLVQALSILSTADADLLEEAQFELALLEEFALDPRPYDHNHPANRRPNHVFGEWDPHHLDALGRHRRFVARQTTLDAMLARVQEAPEAERNERLFEASAALAGTMLMASALCGRQPHAHESGVTLSTLVPRIAQLRDEFYRRLIATIPGPRGERLRAEAQQLRQPFGGARRDLNLRIAHERALQLQERHLAVFYASLGCAEASRERATRIATASVRIAAQARSAITNAFFGAARGELEFASRELAAAESLLHRGIECGALADPWSMLGFQGLYPLFSSREDSIYDPRVDELLGLAGDLFGAYAQVLAEAAARGRDDWRAPLTERMTALANWWDQYAGYEIQDLPRVNGGEAAAAAAHVAGALARWRQRDAAGQPPDLAFWRQHLEGFQTPAAYARVIAALMDRGDLRAAMGLLMAWVSEAPKIELEDGDHSFHALARRWMTDAAGRPSQERTPIVRKFFELLEANADALWELSVEIADSERQPSRERDDESPFESAYEGVTFRDSADDGTEGALLGDGPAGGSFSLEERERDLNGQFQFLTTVADLWREAAGALSKDVKTLRVWRRTAGERLQRFDAVLDQLQSVAIPAPVGGLEATCEYDRRRAVKESLIESALAAALACHRALRTLSSRLPDDRKDAGTWADGAIRVERALHVGDLEALRLRFREFLVPFSSEPLLYVPLSAGGEPAQILRARNAQGVVVQWLEQLPQMGLLRETYSLMETAREMEKNGPGGRRVTEFDRLFPAAIRATVGAVLDLADNDSRFDEIQRNDVLRRLAKLYVDLWIEHSDSIRLSVLESVDSAVKWERIRGFVQRFGRTLFTTGFLQLANLRSIVHRGVPAWFDEADDHDGIPDELAQALETDLPREQAAELLGVILQALCENYDEYRDYNATTTQSDYGENLHVLLDFLRVKAAYERDHWRLKPLVIVHDVLCRRGRTQEAADWRQGLIDHTQAPADRHLAELSQVEERHGMRLRTVRDRLEERFIAPLKVDRISALLPPAWKAAQQGADENDDAVARLQSEVDALAAKPLGVGLDVPPWLDRLEGDLLALRRTGVPNVPPPSRLTLEELHEQLAHEWAAPPRLE